MEVMLIECKNTDVPKGDTSTRSFVKEFAVKLADSIKIDGLYNPIVVRTNPAAPGRYVLVQGKNRLYATKSVLKEQFIRATVLPDMDEAEAAMATIVENLWRNPLNRAQHAKSVIKWHDHWVARHTAAEEAKAAPVNYRGDKSGDEAGEAVEPVAKARITRDDEFSETSFDKTVAAATGQGVAAVRRAKALGKAFSEEQLEVFTQMEVSQDDMLTVSKIKDDDKRSEVINLIASGMDVEPALKELLKDEAPTAYHKKNAEAKAERAEKKALADAAKVPDLTDDEWFDTYCGEKAAMFKNPDRFKSDALLFHLATDPRAAFRSQMKKGLAATKKAGNYGGLWNLCTFREILYVMPPG